MERETGFEPATSTLARLHSTTELLPQSVRLRAPKHKIKTKNAIKNHEIQTQNALYAKHGGGIQI